MLKIEPTYGSDRYGLVWGYRFVPGQPGEPITPEAALTFLTESSAAARNDFLWLHFSLSNSASVPWLQENFPLPEAFYESLHGDTGATRLEQDGDALVAVIHDVLFDFNLDSSAISSTSLCMEPRLLISARLRPLRSIDQLRAAVRAGQIFRSPVELLAHLLQDQANVLVDILRQSTLKVDRIEDQFLANQISTSRRELGSLRRVLVRLQRLLAPEPAALFRLLNRPPDWITEEDLQDLRESAEEFSAAVSDSVALTERVKLIQEELAAQVNDQTNRTLFVLTMVTVLALPINLVAGLFGMNVGGIPLAEHDHGFFWVVIVLITVTSLLAYLALKRIRRD
jgi:zinc transporter